jgi:glycosyltransferase involved in cell wall biosynthesis
VTHSRPRISIVIPAYNATATIGACLAAVRAAMAEWGSAELVVIDNGSTDGTYDKAIKLCSSMGRVLQEPEASIGRLRNLGAAATTGPILCFIDSDCLIPPDHFAQALAVLAATGAGAAGSLYALPPSPRWIEAIWFRMHVVRRDGPVRWLNGGNLLVRREAFEAVGGFDETLRTGEDVEFCDRLRAAGTLIYHDRRIAASHLGNPVTFRAFFQHQWWHGLGTTLRNSAEDKPLAISVFYLAGTAAAIGAWIAGLSHGLRAAGLIAASQLVPPALAVGYRALQTRRLVNPPAGMVLYWVYFWGRLAALSSIVFGVPRAHRGRR